MLNIEHLSISTRHPILVDFSYQFKPGNLYGMVAVNGTGKTTLFRSLMGLRPVDNGTVSWVSEDSRGLKQLFFYYESSEWFEGYLSGWDYLTFVKDEWSSKVDIQGVIDQWGMQDYIKLPIKTYSLGMKQRLVIALYLVSDAQCLLMDEITNGLDENSRDLFFEVLDKLKKAGKLIILSSHYKDDIEAHCDYLLMMANQTVEVITL